MKGPVPIQGSCCGYAADSVEAAVRSLSEKTQVNRGLIRKTTRISDDGQLDRCDLTLKDLKHYSGQH